MSTFLSIELCRRSMLGAFHSRASNSSGWHSEFGAGLLLLDLNHKIYKWIAGRNQQLVRHLRPFATTLASTTWHRSAPARWLQFQRLQKGTTDFYKKRSGDISLNVHQGACSNGRPSCTVQFPPANRLPLHTHSSRSHYIGREPRLLAECILADRPHRHAPKVQPKPSR